MIFFNHFLLHKQKKVIRCRATPDKTPHPNPLPLKMGERTLFCLAELFALLRMTDMKFVIASV